MVKHTQIIRRLLPTADELFEFDHFVGLALKEITSVFHACMGWTVSFERFPNISVFTYVLEELPFFQITSDYLILCFPWSSCGELPLILKVIHLIVKARFSIAHLIVSLLTIDNLTASTLESVLIGKWKKYREEGRFKDFGRR